MNYYFYDNIKVYKLEVLILIENMEREILGEI